MTTLDDPLIYWQEKHKQESAARNNRLGRAIDEYSDACYLALDNNMTMQAMSDYLYVLWGPNDKWRINIYPERNRLHSPPESRGPFLRLYGEWGLVDVVLAAIDSVGGY